MPLEEPAFSRLDLDFATPAGAHRLVYAFDRSSQVQDFMYATLEGRGFYEPETTVLLASVLKPGDTFIDVGAHVGYFSVLAAALVGAAGRVIAFEPEPRNYARLVEHVRLNGFAHVVPVPSAAGSEEGMLEFHFNSDNDGGHALWDVGRHLLNERSRAAPRSFPVEVTTVDRIVGRQPPGRVRAIKIDVEGNEHAVVRGAQRTIESHQVPFVIAEVNRTGLEQLGTSESALRAYMTGLGFETWLLQPGEPQLVRLDATQTVSGNFVFNLLFRRPGAAIG
jgi:FkbM family methyltransferase